MIITICHCSDDRSVYQGADDAAVLSDSDTDESSDLDSDNKTLNKLHPNRRDQQANLLSNAKMLEQSAAIVPDGAAMMSKPSAIYLIVDQDKLMELFPCACLKCGSENCATYPSVCTNIYKITSTSVIETCFHDCRPSDVFCILCGFAMIASINLFGHLQHM